MPIKPQRRPRRFKLRSILFAVSVAVLLLPLAGVLGFRLYEGELVKQTEIELISQAAVMASIYRQELERAAGAQPYGIKTATVAPQRDDASWPADGYYTPVKPQLNLYRYSIKHRPEDARKTEQQADPIAAAASKQVWPVIVEAQRTTLSGVRLLDYRGIVVGGRDDMGLSLIHLEEVREALAGRYASSIRDRTIRRPTPFFAFISRGTGVRVFVAYPVTSRDRLCGVIFLSRTPPSIFEHLYERKEKVFLLASVVLLFALALAMFTSYTIARPLHALIEQTRRFGRGERGVLAPLKSPVTEEVALLSESFSDMARSLEHRSEYIRNFATHVSHEFKTPLTAIQGAVELLQEHASDMTKEKRARFLENIAADSYRLKRLVDRLLEMARADVVERAAGQTALAPLIGRLQTRYRGLGLSVEFDAGDLRANLAITTEVLETVFTNLLDNSRQSGANRVDIFCARVDGRGAITVRDDGRGISSANAEKIFTPFFTTHREGGGTGLGLGIVRTLLEAFGGEIALVPSESGATFRFSIPLRHA